eukprot:m.205857 g.205857  ORF g.205857 m.205857 type:complete len:67 (+) comp39665_c0_seq1:530-730(+)
MLSGKSCSGDAKHYEICNQTPCPREVDWKNTTCSRINYSNGNALEVDQSNSDACKLWRYDKAKRHC